MTKWIIPIEHAAIIVTAVTSDMAKMIALAVLEDRVGKDIFFWNDIGEPTKILDKPILVEYLNEEIQVL